MTNLSLQTQLETLVTLPRETEWVEFKENNDDPERIGQNLSALSNTAILCDQNRAWLVWGVRDSDHEIVGTSFTPSSKKVGNQEFEGWLATKCYPRLDFRIHEFEYGKGRQIVIIEIFPCWHTPVRFGEHEYIRVGSTTRKLKDYPEKERALWEKFNRTPFEQAIAQEGVSGTQALELLDYTTLFELLAVPLPEGRSAILERLVSEKFLVEAGTDAFDVTNLGAILFARNLSDFDTLARKALRVIVYRGNNRVETVREQVGGKGYAAGFEGLIRYVNEQLPNSEVLGQALRSEVRAYPEIAIRELVANAIIHQDFTVTGDGPKVEIFDDRVEFTNPGRPLIDPLRFVDEPPQSRNEALAGLMRRMNICEERGSGIDKVVFHIELHQLPAPEFSTTELHTIVALFAPMPLARMDKRDKIRACYLHACLKRVSNDAMTNESLRLRLNIPDAEYPKASRIIRDTKVANLIKPFDPNSSSKRHSKYLPFWA